MFRLDNKTAVITGGGSGIGEATARTFATQGAIVYLLDRNINEAQQVADSICKEGGKAFAIEADVSSSKSVNVAFNDIAKTSKIDILVNSAGIAQIANLEQTSEEDLDKIYAVNVRGTFNTMKAAIAEFSKSGGGVICNLASIASFSGLSDRLGYSMSKGAVLTMTYSVAKDYIAKNIRVNCISPARVHTPFVDNFLKNNYPGQEEEMFAKLSASQPIGRMGKPSEIAALILYLCSDEASFITGSNFPIDGGFLTVR